MDKKEKAIIYKVYTFNRRLPKSITNTHRYQAVLREPVIRSTS